MLISNAAAAHTPEVGQDAWLQLLTKADICAPELRSSCSRDDRHLPTAGDTSRHPSSDLICKNGIFRHSQAVTDRPWSRRLISGFTQIMRCTLTV